MKLWYQSMTAEGANSAYLDEVRRQVALAVPANCEVHFAGIPRQSEHSDHQFRFYELIDTREVLSNSIRAEHEGYSAFLIGNIADPGLHHVRELCSFPVLGLGDISIFSALQIGRRIGFVSINARQTFELEEKVGTLGLGREVVGIEELGLSRYRELNNGYQPGDDSILELFVSRVERLRERGADVIVPVGGVLMALLSSAEISTVGQLPIVNGVYALAAMGAAFGALFDRQGHFTSKSVAYASPPPAALAEIRRDVGEK